MGKLELSREVMKCFFPKCISNQNPQIFGVNLSSGLWTCEAIARTRANYRVNYWGLNVLPERWYSSILSPIPVRKGLTKLLLHVHHIESVPGEETNVTMGTTRLTTTDVFWFPMVIPHLLVFSSSYRGSEGRNQPTSLFSAQ